MAQQSIAKYLTEQQLSNYLAGQNVGIDSTDNQVKKLMSNRTTGIEGLPYQFLSSTDRRITGTEIGRKYAERIFGRLPLLFLTPCEPLFMDDFSKKQKEAGINSLLGGVSMPGIDKSGRYYSVDFKYDEYYKYVNCMLASVAAFLGLFNEKIVIDGDEKRLGTVDWSKEMNSAYKTFFSAAENVIFYLDGMTSVSESFSNDTTESSLASQINGFSDTANEIRFLFGSGGNVAAELANGASEVTSSITSSLSGGLSKLGGGIVGSLSQKGVNAVLNGGKIIFPEIWSNSTYERSYSIDIKLRSPDHDSLSIFLNVLKPYCKILAMTMARQIAGDPNGYSSPFLVKAYSKGLFSVDMGIISGLSVTKGAECCWNDDGLPTQIDISIDIKDLYKSLGMSGFPGLNANPVQSFKSLKAIVDNTAYMDFLANMAGLNIAQMEMGRRARMLYYLTQANTSTLASSTYLSIENSISRLINKLYNTI